MIPSVRMGPHRGVKYIESILYSIPLPEEHLREENILFVQISIPRRIMGQHRGRKKTTIVHLFYFYNKHPQIV